MLLEHAVPVLALALDRTPDIYNQMVNAISPGTDTVSEAEQSALDAALDRFLLSDVNRKGLRLFIPITDELYPIHYTGSTGNHNKGVEAVKVTNKVTQETEVSVSVTPGRNATTLQFQIKSNLSALSSIADILNALAGMNVLNSADVPRVSFFSSSRCVFNARLVGVNRTTTADTDKELITLTLEEGDGKPIKAGKPDAPEFQLPNTAGDIPAAAAATLLTGEGSQISAEFTDFDPAYAFYLVAKADYLAGIPVPDFESEQTIQRQDYRLFRVKSHSYDMSYRDMQGIAFGGRYITLESAEPFRYDGPLALVRYLGDLYLGVRRAG